MHVYRPSATVDLVWKTAGGCFLGELMPVVNHHHGLHGPLGGAFVRGRLAWKMTCIRRHSSRQSWTIEITRGRYEEASQCTARPESSVDWRFNLRSRFARVFFFSRKLPAILTIKAERSWARIFLDRPTDFAILNKNGSIVISSEMRNFILFSESILWGNTTSPPL